MDTLDSNKLKEEIGRSCSAVEDEVGEKFSRYFRENFGESLLAVILYGSCLNEKTRTPTSIHDFYLIVDSYWKFYQKKLHALLNLFLPPNSFNLKINDEQHHHPLFCKYNVISLERFKKETSSQAKDIYHFGRFGKRVGIVWVKSESIRQELLNCFYQAIRTNVLYTIPTLPDEFTLKDFLLSALSLSYQGETRTENDNKVQEFYEAEKPFYQVIYGSFLNHFIVQHSIIKDPATGTYRFQEKGPQRELEKKRIESFLKKSKGDYRGHILNINY
jgi:hypothetical protein